MGSLLLHDHHLLELIRPESERLQGVWSFFSGSREAQLHISGNQFSVQFKNGELYRGSFTLDPTARPKRMSMEIVHGPERHRGRIIRFIYALDSNRLLLASNKFGEEDAPRFFPQPEDKSHMRIIFERMKRK